MTAHYRNQATELAPIRNKIKELQTQVQALGIPTTLVMSENTVVNIPPPQSNSRQLHRKDRRSAGRHPVVSLALFRQVNRKID